VQFLLQDFWRGESRSGFSTARQSPWEKIHPAGRHLKTLLVLLDRMKNRAR
jgi:hypothetical protein